MTDVTPRPTHNSLVAKHNTLLPKLSKMDLSELRLLSYCLAHYDSRPNPDPDGQPSRMQGELEIESTVQDLLDIFPYMDKKSAYGVVRKAVKGINSKPLEDTYITPDGEEFEMLTYWFSSFKYFKAQGKFIFSLSRDIAHLVLNLSENFTKFKLRDVYQFRSALTWKLYELLKQWVPVGRWSADLDEIRAALGLAGKYPEWYDFKRRVLDAPIKEINKLSDITVNYEKQKRSRSVNGVIFFINLKAEDEARPRADVVIGDTNSDLRKLIAVGINQTNAERLSELAQNAGKDLSVLLNKAIARYDNLPEDKRTSPRAGYVYKALVNEFTPNLFDYAAGQTQPEHKAVARVRHMADDHPEEDETWEQIKHDLANSLSKNLFDTWIIPLGFRRQGSIAILIAPNNFFGKQVSQKLSSELQALQIAITVAGFSDIQHELCSG